MILNKNLLVTYGGLAIVLNHSLLDGRGAWHNLPQLRRLHLYQLKLLHAMTKCSDIYTLVEASRIWTDIQYKLQDAWGFERDSNYHRFWDLPHCTCPVMDNNDAYPTKYTMVHSGCYHALI